jgi:hypothetical protein
VVLFSVPRRAAADHRTHGIRRAVRECPSAPNVSAAETIGGGAAAKLAPQNSNTIRAHERRRPHLDSSSEAPPSPLWHVALRGKLRIGCWLREQQRMRGALRRIAAVQGLRLPEPAEPGSPALRQRMADLVTLHRGQQDRHRAGRPDSRAHAEHHRTGSARPQGQPRGAARPFVAPAQAARQILADRSGVQRARIARSPGPDPSAFTSRRSRSSSCRPSKA